MLGLGKGHASTHITGLKCSSEIAARILSFRLVCCHTQNSDLSQGAQAIYLNNVLKHLTLGHPPEVTV